jgi:hypothetical protein
LTSALFETPDDKLTSFALRLALTGYVDIQRECEFDFLAEAEAALVPPPTAKKKPKTNKPTSMIQLPRPARRPHRRRRQHPRRRSQPNRKGGSHDRLPPFAFSQHNGLENGRRLSLSCTSPFRCAPRYGGAPSPAPPRTKERREKPPSCTFSCEALCAAGLSPSPRPS